ncbi:MAG TPA: type IV pilus twitching motility protein PilT [Candidatus Krumholzibacteria bacterium]|nr:type IV pilus twitching motility protein PilT [Candidatus Krumholzibacteria bacterium]
MINLRELLEKMIQMKASDLHLTAGLPPQFRVDGSLVSNSEYAVLTPEECTRLAYSVLNEEHKRRFENDRELDLSFGIAGLSRFRCNVFLQRGVVTMAVRQIPYQILNWKQIGVPQVLADMVMRPKGMVLVTGPTGSGKSTTLASLIDRINNERRCHIVTIEDPIEYVHEHKRCIVNQREVRADTHSFQAALKHVLRQDPDVILVGEMRDRETMAAALTIAETGHLCLATLHTNSTFESVNRIVDSFPSEQQPQVRAQLAFVLEGVITQQLVPRASGKGRVLVAEVMICTPAIRAVVREGKIHQIYGLMQAGAKYGMQTMNQALHNAVISRLITANEAMSCSPEQLELERMLTATTGMPVGAK